MEFLPILTQSGQLSFRDTVLITSVNVKKARLYYLPQILHNPLPPFNLKINELI